MGDFAVLKKTSGEGRTDYATSLNTLGLLYQAKGDYAKAEPLYRSALEINKRALGESHPNCATILNNLGTLYQATGEYAKAEACVLSALEIDKRALGEGHPEYAQRLNNLAVLYEAMGQYAKAEPLFRQAVEIYQRALGENHPAYAGSLSNLAMLYLNMANYAKAESLLRRALEIKKNVLGEVHPEYAKSLDDLAELYQVMGDYADAEPLDRRAVEILKRALGENHPDYASSLVKLAVLYKTVGDYAKAEPLYRQAKEIQKRVLGENHTDYATSLNNLGSVYERSGDSASAERLYRGALEIYKRSLGERHPSCATVLSNLGALYQHIGDYKTAEPLMRDALEIRKRALGENHPDYAQSLNNLGLLYVQMRDYAHAEPLFLHAIEIIKRALGENHSNHATSLHNLAALYEYRCEYAKAEPLHRSALEIYKRALGENHPDYAHCLITLALCYSAQGRLAAAEQLLRQGLTILTRWTQAGLAAFGERQRIRLLTAQGYALYNYISIAPGAGMEVAEIYRHVLAWKGVVDARQDEDRVARDQPELTETLRMLEQARGRLAGLAFTAPSAGDRQAWLEQLNALRDRKENLESDLAGKSRAFRQIQETRRLGVADVAAALPPGTLLVDFLDYDHGSRPAAGKGPLEWERRLVAFVLPRSGVPVFVPLGASRPIDEAVQAWRTALIAGTPEPMQKAAADLSRRVWEPLKPHLEGASEVLVAPDGALMYFPLAALPGRRPGTYLVEDLAIGYVSSTHRLVATLAAPNEGKPKSTEDAPCGLLAIGGIDYQGDPGPAVPADSAPAPSVLLAGASRAAFGALAGTGPEVQSIGKLFDAAFPRQRALVLTGAAPTEAGVKRQLARSPRYLHLATHGFFESPARVAAMRAGLKADEFGLSGAIVSDESASLALAPLLHSGVALVGAARRFEDLRSEGKNAPTDHDDGILTAEEVQALDLRGTDLVVLSACETGLGKLEYGQGVQGLERAFQAAGARAVVASLWKVDDAATTVLMEQFYTNLWSKKMPKLEALRQAQLTVLNNPALVTARRAELAKQRGIDEKPNKLPDGGRVAPPADRATRSNPAHWAAFVLSGDVR